ncbi:MAG: hypothetical protein ABJN65_00605 [Parasphingorhabdus sp.]
MGFQNDIARALAELRGDGLDGEGFRGIPDQVRDRNDEINDGDAVCRPSRLREGSGVGLPEDERVPSPSPSRKREGHLVASIAPTQTPPLKESGIETASTRHDGWSPDVRVKFLEALANCGNVGSAAVFVQRSRTSAYNLKRRDMDFALAWDAALLLARDVATDMLQDRAINGVEEEVYYRGEVIATRRRYDSRLLLAHIARLDKLAESAATSRAAARFNAVTEAIAAEDTIASLITEPTEAEKVERARMLSAAGYTMEDSDAATSDAPVEPFMCTFNDDPPEIYMMTESEAEELDEEVNGLTVRLVDKAEAAAVMAEAKDRNLEDDATEAEDIEDAEEVEEEAENKYGSVHVVNFEQDNGPHPELNSGPRRVEE